METNKIKFDYSYLRGFLNEHSITLEQLGILLNNKTRQTINNKLRGKSRFTYEEIDFMKRHFNLSDKQVELFFYKRVAK